MKDTLEIRTNRAALVAELEKANSKFRGNLCYCVFHDDRHASGGIYEKNGIWRFKCQACGVGGDIFDIRAKLNNTTSLDEIKKLSAPKQQEKKQFNFASLDAVRKFLIEKIGFVENEYLYTNKDGDYFMTIFRCKTQDGKTFRPCHLIEGGYSLTSPPKPWPLYNLSAIAQAETVIITEGEKAADVLKKYGFCAVTSAGGAKNAKSTDWTPLKNKKIILWPDNDSEGRLYISTVENILRSL